MKSWLPKKRIEEDVIRLKAVNLYDRIKGYVLLALMFACVIYGLRYYGQLNFYVFLTIAILWWIVAYNLAPLAMDLCYWWVAKKYRKQKKSLPDQK